MQLGIWAAFDGTPVGRNDRLHLSSRHALGRSSYAHNGYSCTARVSLLPSNTIHSKTAGYAEWIVGYNTTRPGRKNRREPEDERMAALTTNTPRSKPSRVESRLIRFGGNREIGFCWLLPLRFETDQRLFDSDRWNVSFTSRLLCRCSRLEGPRDQRRNIDRSIRAAEPPSSHLVDATPRQLLVSFSLRSLYMFSSCR